MGSDDLVNLGDSVASVDLPTGPVLLGEGFYGSLDELALYDFSRPPMMTFEGGAVETEVILDASGTAELAILARPTNEGVGGGLSGTHDGQPLFSTEGVPSGPFVDWLRQVPVRTFVAPESTTPDVLPEPFYLDAYLKARYGNYVSSCVDGLGSGESEEVAGMICDFVLQISPIGSVADARDVYVVAEAFVQGKATTGDYIKGAFAVAGLAAALFPPVRAGLKAFRGARLAVEGTEVEVRIAREVLERASRSAVTGEAVEVGIAARILGSDTAGQPAKDGMALLLGACSIRVASLVAIATVANCAGLGQEALKSLERVAPRMGGEEAFVATLGRLRTLGLSEDGVRRMLEMLNRDEILGLNLTQEAIEGLGRFVAHTRSNNRLVHIWTELTVHTGSPPLSPQAAQEIMERLFVTLKRGDEAMTTRIGLLSRSDPAAAADLARQWHNFIARGAGTAPSRNATGGFFHALENLLDEPASAIVALDDGAFGRLNGYLGRPDLLARNADGLIVQKEFKRIAAGGTLGRADIMQLRGNIGKAVARAGVDTPGLARAAQRANLRSELQRIVYVFRGPERSDLRGRLIEEARKLLDDDLQDLAEELGRAVQFRPGQGLPF